MNSHKRTLAKPSIVAAFVAAAALLAPAAAFAEVKHDGAWPESGKEKLVSIDVVQAPRDVAVQKLADAAGWSLVSHGVTPGELVTLHVKNQPASKVLDLLLTDGDYVAKRDGDIVSIDKVDEGDQPGGEHADHPGHLKLDIPMPPPIPPIPAAPEPPKPPPPPAPTERGEDRTIAGGNLRIEKNETVHDVTVLGGNVDVYGTVTGDVAVMGGNVRLHEGSHVVGDATTFGGALTVDKGVNVDGDVSVVGGRLKRSDQCKIGGTVVTKGGSDDVEDDDDDDSSPAAPSASAHAPHIKMPKMPHKHVGSAVRGWISDVGESLTQAALLFVFGAVLLALAPKRMEMMRAEVASRPMRNFALGIVGFFASILVIVALCITVIGIPVAVVGLVLGLIALFAGICALLAVVGQALLRHKTPNQYVHLALGCALFLVACSIPYFGDFVKLVVGAIGIGVLVATRVGGLVPSKKRPAEGPYRTPPEDAPVAPTGM